MDPETRKDVSHSSSQGSRNRHGGGVFIAIGGGLMGQASAGLLAGLVLGALVALLIWWQGR